MATKHLSEPFALILRQMGASIQRTSLAPHKIKLSFPVALPYEAFDGSARVKPWHLINLVECCRGAAFVPNSSDNIGSFLDFIDVSRDHFHFVRNSQLNVSKEMYDASFPKSPLDLFLTLHHVGKSSMIVRTEAMHPCHPEPLFTNLNMTVCVSSQTRKPTPLPDFWMEKYRHLAEGEPIRFDPPKPPSDPSRIFSYPRVVMAGDVDPYLHLNWSATLRYCHEGRMGSMLDRGESVAPGNLTMAVRSATMGYLQEGNLGDRLAVDHWQGENGCWHFALNKGGQPVSVAVIDYHDS